MPDEDQNPYRQAREVENDALSRMTEPSPKEIGWDEGYAAGLHEAEAALEVAAQIMRDIPDAAITEGGWHNRAFGWLAAHYRRLAAATPDPPDPRLDAVYAERNAVVLGLAKAGLMLGWRVGKASDPNEPDWPVVYIDTPAGQVSWHFRAADVPDWVEPYPGEWDRHSDREKYERLSRLPTAPAASPDERLREATDALATIYVILTGAEPMWAEMPVGERCARAANEAQQAFLSLDLALAAADREENTDG